MNADTRLATYGTLAPGKPNHHQLAQLRGRWMKGMVSGALVRSGWGAALGFPALVFDATGSSVPVDLFESADLPRHWARLDEFEGEGYRRVVVEVETEEGSLASFIYVAADQHAGD
jgi:gamma-glutamylcyclotransferase (GGCT)/AIG2-like uncharacterized protein YtfP